MTADGQLQMAVDAWLFKQHCAGHCPPTLRFYRWSPVALSLGYHQRRYPDRWHQLQWRGAAVDCVRRPTGGRAVLHQGDLTYMLVTSGLSGSRRQGYEHLCKFLIAGWRQLGVTLTYGQAQRGYGQTPNCFATATAADLVTSDGVKLIGSAQRCDLNCVLQHGSIRLNPDPALFQQVFQETVKPVVLPPSLRSLSMDQQHQQIIAALVAAASAHFNTVFFTQPLSPEEIEQAKAMAMP
ncbi:MAG: biotin/lipoate A/B protein ligase family protein [Cyanobacteria bacterium J06632_22]